LLCNRRSKHGCIIVVNAASQKLKRSLAAASTSDAMLRLDPALSTALHQHNVGLNI
jgi:hypothetical protein